jgi:peptidyl-prolyl cis-trans isomerase SurA
MTKMRFGCWVVIFLCLSGFATQAELLDRIAAVVNDDVILFSSVNEKCEQKFMDIPANLSDAEVEKYKTTLRKEALDLMIDEMLKRQKIREHQLQVSTIELDAYVSSIIRNNKLTEKQFKEALRYEGQTMEDYREMLRKGMLDRKLMQWLMSQEGRSGLEVSSSAVADDYQTHYKQPSSSKRVRASHILFSVPLDTTPEQEALIRQRAEKVLAAIQKGSSFGAMARKESDDPSSAVGGDLGWFRKGDMVGPFEDAAFSMKKGQVSDLVKTRFGFHIIKIRDIDFGVVPSIEQVENEIRARLAKKLEKRFLKNWLKDLRRHSYIDIK